MSTGSNETLLSITDLERHYGYRRVLSGLDINVSRKEIVCILGPNGAGKSTLLSSITALEEPEKGSLLICGRRLISEKDRREAAVHIGFLGHEPGVFLDLTAAENLFFFGRLYGLRLQKDRVHELLSECGLGVRADDSVRSFSRGMRQRLGLARAILHKPSLLVFDEPLTGLDTDGERYLNVILARHAADGGGALLVTHADEPFRETATRYAFLHDGAIVADITADRYTDAARNKVRSILYSN
ncbi:MAG: heme ABC exporter ATP-binding protein CcmA [Spirochaetia bacterium]|nr:heme ABC exporter ATP-binding protein CcmA [Spirochaetia bacterium]